MDEIWWVLSDSNREGTKPTDLQSALDTITRLSTHDISFADALFAMLNGINCSLTVYVHSYGGLTFTQWLTSAKLIPHLITLGCLETTTTR